MPRFLFICKSSTKRPGPVWDATLHPVMNAVENDRQFVGLPGGQIQLVGLKTDTYVVDGIYLVDITPRD